MQRDANTGSGQVPDPEGSAAPPEPGTVRVVPGARVTRVVLTGEIDADLGPELVDAAAAAEQAGRPVVVDVERVRFMDSTGVAFLARLASRSPGRLVLVRPPELVRFLIEVTSIREVLDVVDDEGDAGTSAEGRPGADRTVADRPDDGRPDDDGDPDLIA